MTIWNSDLWCSQEMKWSVIMLFSILLWCNTCFCLDCLDSVVSLFDTIFPMIKFSNSLIHSCVTLIFLFSLMIRSQLENSKLNYLFTSKLLVIFFFSMFCDPKYCKQKSMWECFLLCCYCHSLNIIWLILSREKPLNNISSWYILIAIKPWHNDMLVSMSSLHQLSMMTIIVWKKYVHKNVSILNYP